MSNVCPVCKKDDQIKKIAAIRMEGASNGVFVGSTGGITVSGGKLGTTTGMAALSGRTVTDLARVLPPPAEPKVEKPSSPLIALLCIVGAIMELIGFVTLSTNSGVALFIGGILLFIIAAAIGFNIQSTKKEEYALKNKKARDAWKKQMEIYNRLYYCSRDYISFDPDTGEYRPLMETWQLLQ